MPYLRCIQTVRLRKTLQTYITFIWLLIRMHSLVPVQTAQLRKSFFTYVAFRYFLICIHCLMCVQICSVRKRLVTYVELKQFFTCMHSDADSNFLHENHFCHKHHKQSFSTVCILKWLFKFDA